MTSMLGGTDVISGKTSSGVASRGSGSRGRLSELRLTVLISQSAKAP